MTATVRRLLARWLRHVLVLGFLPVSWRIPCFALFGIAAGLAIIAVRVSEAHSYLLDDSRTCINCHVMVPQYATWERSSHARSAACNDCHVPHTSILRKYAFKARDGLRHATLFTLRLEPQVIRATAHARHVIQENCVDCHQEQLSGAFLLRNSGRRCTDCHQATPHGEVRSLTATPDVRYPRLTPLVRPPFGETHD